MNTCACEHDSIAHDHHHQTGTLPVSAEAAQQVSRLMAALATASRVRILDCLRADRRTVGELTAAIGMEQPAVSHQLRVLRDLGLVTGTRQGRHVVYALYDSHVAALLDEALRHVEHVQAGASETAPTR